MPSSDRVTAAIAAFWGSRATQLAAIGNSQGGTRDAVVGGQHLNAVRDLLVDEMIRTGAPIANTHATGSAKTMPGYFRPSKNWDLAVKNDAGAVAALFELKSQVGSFGNNANNRAEEAVGNPIDLDQAVAHGIVPVRPWTAYIFVIEDAEASRHSRNTRATTAYPIDPVFETVSYVDRVGILAERAVESGLYDAAWVVATPKPAGLDSPVFWSDANETVSWRAFSAALSAFVERTFAGMTGGWKVGE